ncbi:hypothetical protein [Mesobacillus zeae]|uniref:hypothetical protein n=1 Tax=Mesobacillus zeae TaxID=1917180 RepID=UPI00300AF850
MEKKLLLPLNLQLFAEDAGTASTDASLNTDAQAAQQPTNQTAEHMIPKSRFDEVNSSYKTAKEQLDKILAEKAAAEKKAQEEQGKFQELYEKTNQEYDQFKSKFESVEVRAKELEGVINGLLETKLEAISADYHDLIPNNLTPEQKLDWINKAETKGLFGKKEQAPIGDTTNPSHAQSFDLNSLTPMQMLKAGYGSK